MDGAEGPKLLFNVSLGCLKSICIHRHGDGTNQIEPTKKSIKTRKVIIKKVNKKKKSSVETSSFIEAMRKKGEQDKEHENKGMGESASFACD